MKSINDLLPYFRTKSKLASRAQFELLVTEITGCKVGDGTLAVDADHVYTNTYVQYFWGRFQAARNN